MELFRKICFSECCRNDKGDEVDLPWLQRHDVGALYDEPSRFADTDPEAFERKRLEEWERQRQHNSFDQSTPLFLPHSVTEQTPDTRLPALPNGARRQPKGAANQTADLDTRCEETHHWESEASTKDIYYGSESSNNQRRSDPESCRGRWDSDAINQNEAMTGPSRMVLSSSANMSNRNAAPQLASIHSSSTAASLRQQHQQSNFGGFNDDAMSREPSNAMARQVSSSKTSSEDGEDSPDMDAKMAAWRARKERKKKKTPAVGPASGKASTELHNKDSSRMKFSTASSTGSRASSYASNDDMVHGQEPADHVTGRVPSGDNYTGASEDTARRRWA